VIGLLVVLGIGGMAVMHFEIPGVGVLTATAAVSVTHAGFL